MQSNIVVKGICAFIVLLALVVGIKKFSGNAADIDDPVTTSGGEAVSEETFAALGLEGDTEQDTVKTLIGEVLKLKDEITGLRDDNKQIRDDNEGLRKMETTISRRATNEISKAAERIQKKSERSIQSMQEEARSEYQQIMGKFGGDKKRSVPGGKMVDQTGTVWVEPLGREQQVESNNFPLDFLKSARSGGKKDIIGVDKLPGVKGRKRGEEDITPVYTIAKNSTLVGSTAMTALVGRVPVGTNVVDPYSFRVIIGQDNLIANGIEVPEIAYSVASGKAVGDWTLGCVRGFIHSITFVFKDGTIRTVPKAKDIYEGATKTQEVPIGELADNFGNPCVVGSRITNAYTYLAQRIGVSAAGAAAEAAAATNTTSFASIGNGGTSVSTVIDGSTGEYILGKTFSDTAKETARWLDERQSQNFDAIYVAPGRTVAILINEEIRIDYDSLGRKTQHTNIAFGGKNRELD